MLLQTNSDLFVYLIIAILGLAIFIALIRWVLQVQKTGQQPNGYYLVVNLPVRKERGG